MESTTITSTFEYNEGEKELMKHIARTGVLLSSFKEASHLEWTSSLEVFNPPNNDNADVQVSDSSDFSISSSISSSSISSSSSSSSSSSVTPGFQKVFHLELYDKLITNSKLSIKFYKEEKKVIIQEECHHSNPSNNSNNDSFRERFIRWRVNYSDALCNLDTEDLPDRIIENVYLGGHEAALNFECLKQRNVTHIITAGRSLRMAFPHDFKYKYIDILDWEEEDIFQYFESCMDFIHEARTTGGAILIHCAAGVSRSATITIAYLMYSCGYEYADARDYVSSKRWIHPNNGFVRQLIQWEKLLSKNWKDKKKLKKKLLLSNQNSI